MKKFIVFAVILGLLAPAAAFAATEFSLGGFIKLDSFWDSTQQTKNMNGGWVRNNVSSGGNHGRMKFTAQGSRFNFTIKGPDLWGAKTSGFIEMDFDISEQGATTPGIPAAGATASASNNYVPRLRHAMFRFNWPETELLFGQYFSMFCEWYPELAEDGPFQATGMATARLPQIRVTQKFLGWGTASLLIGSANNSNLGQVYSISDTTGQSSATPQVQGKLMYAQDLWGKAAFYGKPTPFTVSLVAGWQRSHFQEQQTVAAGLHTWQNNSYSNNLANVATNHQTLDPWLVQGSVFIPVIPTSSANLAGTASILTQWYAGAGLDSFGFTGAGNFYKFNNNNGGVWNLYDYELQKRWGGFVQGQYYFNNQWFVTAAYGISQQFGADLYATSGAAMTPGAGNNNVGFKYALPNVAASDLINLFQQAEVCLWYRPIQAIKFGLEYAYGAQNWFQTTSANGAVALGAVGATPLGYVANPTNTSRDGAAHRVEFVGFFYF